MELTNGITDETELREYCERLLNSVDPVIKKCKCGNTIMAKSKSITGIEGGRIADKQTLLAVVCEKCKRVGIINLFAAPQVVLEEKEK